MARPKSLTSLSIEALLRLRDDVGATLARRANEMKQQLARLGGGGAETSRRGRRKGGPLKGRKIAPKYRGPRGETWAGRGARPRWLVDALKGGKKLDDFLIAKRTPAAKRKTKR
jgi:DNA-binding protein H-NS